VTPGERVERGNSIHTPGVARLVSLLLSAPAAVGLFLFLYGVSVVATRGPCTCYTYGPELPPPPCCVPSLYNYDWIYLGAAILAVSSAGLLIVRRRRKRNVLAV
jgi:hypothetical protein